MLRAGALAIVAFQIGYTVLDRVEYPLTFAQNQPASHRQHGGGPDCVRDGAVAACRCGTGARSSLANLCGDYREHGVDRGDRRRQRRAGRVDCVVFLRRGRLAPMESALAGGARGERSDCVVRILDARRRSGFAPGDRTGRRWRARRCCRRSARSMALAIDGNWPSNWRRWPGTIACSGAKWTLRAEIAAARERDHVRLQASEAMLRKVFDASPDNIAINSLADGRFIAVNDEYQVAGYTRDDVMGSRRDRAWDVAGRRGD